MNLRHTPRLYIDADLGKGLSVTPAAEQAHYLQHVMRLKVGDILRLFNGRDGEWSGAVSTLSKRSVELTLHDQTRAQKAEPDLWLCCAPIKKAHFDYMIEKATELGVAVIQPLLTSRTQIREVNIERCRAIAIEAAEQSERLNVPEIKAPITLTKFAGDLSQDYNLVVCAETGEATPVHDVFMQPSLKTKSKTAIITGPEGGFADEEFDLLRKIPHASFIRLGPRILRADTAAIAVLSCWQSSCGDWTSA